MRISSYWQACKRCKKSFAKSLDSHKLAQGFDCATDYVKTLDLQDRAYTAQLVAVFVNEGEIENTQDIFCAGCCERRSK